MVFTLKALSECEISIGDGISIDFSLNCTFGFFGVLHIGSNLLKHGYSSCVTFIPTHFLLLVPNSIVLSISNIPSPSSGVFS